MNQLFAKTKEKIAKNRVKINKDLCAIILEYTDNPQEDFLEEIKSDSYVNYKAIYQKMTFMMDKLGIIYEKELVKRKLLIFSTWLKAADNIVDNDRPESELGLSLFYEDSNVKKTPSEILIDIIRRECSQDPNYPNFLSSLKNLYYLETKVEEPKNAQALVNHRKNEGILTADTMYELIKSHIAYEPTSVRQFFRTLGVLGCLADSATDIKEDMQKYAFLRNKNQQAILYLGTINAITFTVLTYPKLMPEYLSSMKKLIALSTVQPSLS